MILLFTHSGDEYCVPLVAGELDKNQLPYRIVYTDRFPLDYEILLSTSGVHGIIIKQEFIPADLISAVWIRKWVSPGSFVTEGYHPGIFPESDRVLRQFLTTLKPGTKIMDSLECISNSENKWVQMVLAKKCDLLVPDTIITNHPYYSREFTQSRATVVKLQIPLSWSMDGGGEFFYTTDWSDFETSQYKELLNAPLTYQEKVEKKEEYRVIYVDGDFHCGVIPGNIFDRQTDWRIPGTQFQWQTGKLPAPIRGKLKRFMQELGLNFGAIDLIHTPKNEWYFLEVNPTGEWGMLEKNLHLPISKSIARFLSQ
ncbi:MAG: hypothetical protein JNL57_04935 [Bacteroidetes bacterium]|nr:hypothetical protein [Bacteroidota bacterium]